MKKIIRTIVVVFVACVLSPQATADPDVFYATYHSTVTLSEQELRDIFFLRKTYWKDGTYIRIFVLPDNHPIHERFAKEVLGTYSARLRNVWDTKLFSGIASPPDNVDSIEEMKTKLKSIEGSIGYSVNEIK